MIQFSKVLGAVSDTPRSGSKLLSLRNSTLILVAASTLILTGCGDNDNDQKAAAKSMPAIDACALVTNDEVHALAPDVGPGHPGKVKIPNVYTCQWDDAHHLPRLTLQVTPSDPSGVKKSLETGMGNMGYKISTVPGLGDAAAVAVQQPDPKLHTKAGVAILAIRVGQRQLALSPMRLDIAGTNTEGFTKLKTLANQAVARLKTMKH